MSNQKASLLHVIAFMAFVVYVGVQHVTEVQASEGVTQLSRATQLTRGTLGDNEYTSLGYAWDNYIDGRTNSYLDINLSMKYLLGDDINDHPLLPWFKIGFNARFSQYLVEYDSAPVVAKRYNLKLIYGRYWLGSLNDGAGVGGQAGHSYVDIALLAHESNGQSIGENPNDPNHTEYKTQAELQRFKNSDPLFADNYLSRSWNYLDIFLRMGRNAKEQGFVVKARYKYFYLGAQEFYDWELKSNTPYATGTSRSQTDSFTAMLDYNFGDNALKKLSLSYTTGDIHSFSEFNTFKVEALVHFSRLRGIPPLLFWYADGYNSNLVDYYKDVGRGGVALVFSDLAED